MGIAKYKPKRKMTDAAKKRRDAIIEANKKKKDMASVQQGYKSRHRFGK